MMFDLPPMPVETQPVIQQECNAVYSRLIRPASGGNSQRNTSRSSVGDDSSDDSLSSADTLTGSANDIHNLRKQAIKQEAFSIGSQAGLHWRYAGIEHILESEHIAPLLDRGFDFNRVITSNNILLPVISEARQSFQMSEDGQTARSSETAWEIITNARITTTAPSWREYLYQHSIAPTSAPTGLMPYNRGEQVLWQTNICNGFQQGVDIANMIYTDRLNRLVRDYSGMLRFRTLAAQDIVTMPAVDQGLLGVSVQNDRVHVDDRIIRITEPVRFNDSSQWRAVSTSVD